MSYTLTTPTRRIVIVLLAALLIVTLALLAAGAFNGTTPSFAHLAGGGGCKGVCQIHA